jgi:hypothetical protein
MSVDADKRHQMPYIVCGHRESGVSGVSACYLRTTSEKPPLTAWACRNIGTELDVECETSEVFKAHQEAVDPPLRLDRPPQPNFNFGSPSGSPSLIAACRRSLANACSSIGLRRNVIER